MLVTAPRLNRIYIEGPWTPDPDAVRFLRTEARIRGSSPGSTGARYAIWHLAPAGIQVSMDGRRETVYSERVLDGHWAFYQNARDALAYRM